MKKAKNGHTEVSGCAATGNSPGLSSFIARLLAPLPDGEEPANSARWQKRIKQDEVDSRRRKRRIKQDQNAAWWRGFARVEMEDALHTYYARMSMVVPLKDAEAIVTVRLQLSAAEKKSQSVQRDQCLIPAPTLKELRWKQRRDKAILEDSAVQAAMAADQQRLSAAEKGA